jgi:hypothetical protein
LPVTESEKIRSRIFPLLQGKTVIDLGCGMRPIVPWARGVDDMSESKIVEPGSVIAKIDIESQQLGEGLRADVVFSSHAIEHLRAPLGSTLRYWLSLVKEQGRLILYLPDERRYVFNPKEPKARNPGHFHYLTPETFRWYMDQLPVEIEAFEEDPVEFDRYSFLVIARKR